MVILDMTNQHSSAVALRIIYLLLTETAKGKHLIIVQLVEVRPDPRRFASFEGVRLSFLVSYWTNALLISYKDFGIVTGRISCNTTQLHSIGIGDGFANAVVIVIMIPHFFRGHI